MFNNKKKAVVALLMLCAVTALLSACARMPFRLHVIANSNSEVDQNIKLVVRDAVLRVTKDGVLRCKNASEAEEYVKSNVEIIIKTANDILHENDFEYDARATIGEYHFPDKSYNGVTYPEGDYRALRVVLGEGDGDNWWCVMFPPLCISEIDPEQVEDVEYTSLFAELWQSIFDS